MEYEVYITVSVDKDANFLEVDRDDHSPIVQELILNSLYDIDDLTIEKCEVNKHDK